ncbi:lysostaphin resistance A-like protein [Qipengyuania nanhaisediminis]|uniref:CPBP family intramembrane glutamic endopeptidase n=1 Tax=Qipengyuania nanhaisediminis TaxID=604088 RepID=UPI0038B2E1E1
MNDEPTSPLAATGEMPQHAATRFAPAASLADEWRRVLAFLRRPTLPTFTETAGAWRVIARVYALDMAVMFALIATAAIVIASGIDLPRTALADIDFTLPIVLGVIIAAPVFEEIVFRGWLSGKPGPVLALIAIIAGAGAFAAIGPALPLVRGLVLVFALVVAVAALVALRRKPAMNWFERGFPVLFWLSALAFALVHLANFSEGSLAMLLPLVIPQFVLGTLLGYVRVHIGLWAAIVLHAMHNATALTIASLAMVGGEG